MVLLMEGEVEPVRELVAAVQTMVQEVTVEPFVLFS
jgi:hypothetical protein